MEARKSYTENLTRILKQHLLLSGMLSGMLSGGFSTPIQRVYFSFKIILSTTLLKGEPRCKMFFVTYKIGDKSAFV